METAAKAISGASKKLTDVSFFLLLLSLAYFTDTYLIYKYQITVLQITEEWLKSHAALSEILKFIGCFGFFYSLVVPLAWVFFVKILLYVGAYIPFFESLSDYPDSYISTYTLREYAVKNNNSVAYKDLENNIKSNIKTRNIQKLFVSFITIPLARYVFMWVSPPIQNEINGILTYVPWPVIAIFLLFFALSFSDIYFDGFINLKSFRSWEKKPAALPSSNSDPETVLKSSQFMKPRDLTEKYELPKSRWTEQQRMDRLKEFMGKK